MLQFRMRFFWVLSISILSTLASAVDINTPIPNNDGALTVDEVNTIVAQAVGYLKSINERGVIAVVDREGHILAIFRMTQSGGPDIRINEQATAKARTAAFFQSGGNAFTSRTAQFIVQSNFPPGVRNVDAGPLFGVPFSNFPGSDVQLQVPPFIVFAAPLTADATTGTPAALDLPPGNSNARPLLQPLVITPLTDDLGGIPLFKGGRPCGAVGVEIDGFGVLANGNPDAGIKRVNEESKRNEEEAAAVAATRGFEAPKRFRADRILINGFRFPFAKAHPQRSTPVAVGSLTAEGNFEPYFDTDASERNPAGAPVANAYTGTFSATALTLTAPRAAPTPEFPSRGFVPRFPARSSPLGAITQEDVLKIIQQGADRAENIRAAIRNPRGVAARVWITVTDLAGNILGVYRTEDATVFSFDVCVQKARTSAFFSNNQVGFSSRAIGFMSQTYYPPGLEKSPSGPISGLLNPDDSQDPNTLNFSGGAGQLTEISQLLVNASGPAPASAVEAIQTLAKRIPHIRDGRLSPVQAALTVDLTLGRPSNGATPPATTIPNGITIFPGGVPMYKNGVLVGGIGVSGDGVDQDDIIVYAASEGYRPPSGVRCDEASDSAIVQALQEAFQKMKVQFPNLVSADPSTPAVLDVVEKRLQKGGDVLQGLRLPYVKFPRSPNR